MLFLFFLGCRYPVGRAFAYHTHIRHGYGGYGGYGGHGLGGYGYGHGYYG